MTDTPKLEVITTERRKGGNMPSGREPSRMEDLDALIRRTCDSFDRVGTAAEGLTRQLLKA